MSLGAAKAYLDVDELWGIWPGLDQDEKAEWFAQVDPEDAEDFFLSLPPEDQAAVLLALPEKARRLWMRSLDPDDAADVLQEVDEEHPRQGLFGMLEDATRREVTALLAYAEDHAGGLMSPRFARLRPEMTVDEAIAYLRRQARERVETIYYAYVLDARQHLLGVVSFRELFAAAGGKKVADVMWDEPITVRDDADQETVAAIIAREDLMALPVVNAEGAMIGIVTIDDIVDVVQEEATEDIQKLGGMSALDSPYLQTGLWEMVRKRAGWLTVLFAGSLLTTSAMSYYEEAMAKVVMLTIFVPLIISSGGNSGSQAATLVIRAMALGEVRLRDWLKVIKRELISGLLLGLILAGFGLARVYFGEWLLGSYGSHYVLLGLTVASSLIGVVTWGTVSGAGLPFLLRRLGFDPASASAPFVATLVDVVGIIIYFSIAQFFLADLLG